MKASNKYLHLIQMVRLIRKRLETEAQVMQRQFMQYNIPITPLYVSSGEYALLCIDIYNSAMEDDLTIVDSLFKGGYSLYSSLGPISIEVKD